MYYLISVVTGVLISVMIAVNGGLTSFYGPYQASVVIHITGLVFVSFLMLLKREAFFHSRKLRLYIYLGGPIGVATTVFNNIAFGRISVSAILALILLGQSISSIIIDNYGLFKMAKCPFYARKWWGVIFCLCGILFMLSGSQRDAAVPILISFLSGITIVLARTFNADLAKETSVLKSTLYNYLSGLLVSFAVMLLLPLAPWPQLPGITEYFWIYLGGVLGTVIVVFSNLTVTKIPSFYVTLLVFSGQIFSGLLIDFLLTGYFPMKIFIGGIFVALGMGVNLWFDFRQNCRTVPQSL